MPVYLNRGDLGEILGWAVDKGSGVLVRSFCAKKRAEGGLKSFKRSLRECRTGRDDAPGKEPGHGDMA